MLEIERRNKGFLGWIEQVGNKMPHPMALFLYIIILTVLISAITSIIGVSATHPTTGEKIDVTNLLSVDGLLFLFETFVDNFQGFPVLGVVIVLGVVTGICEKTGFFSTAIKMSLSNVKGDGIVFIIALIGVFANQAGDAAFVLIPTLAGAIFYGMGRHPIAGIFCAYAAVGGGFATALIPGGWDVTLTPISISAAQMLDPNFDMTLLNSYYALFVSAILVALATTFVTVKIIEPKLGKYTGKPEDVDTDESFEVTPLEAKAARKAGLAVIIYLAILLILCIPSNSIFRSPKGSLIFQAPLMSSLRFLIILLFFIPGIVYGKETGKITSIKDLNDIIVESIKTLAPFIALALVIGQFLVLFAKSNLGQILAIKGGEFLSNLTLPPQIIVIFYFLLVAFINLFIISGSTKYLIFGPIFVPMLMQLNIHPAFTQFVSRLGDSVTNHLSPLNAFFVILLALCQKYDKKVGMGSIFSSMIPYTVAYFICFVVLMTVWMTLGIDVGVGGSVWLN